MEAFPEYSAPIEEPKNNPVPMTEEIASANMVHDPRTRFSSAIIPILSIDIQKVLSILQCGKKLNQQPL